MNTLLTPTRIPNTDLEVPLATVGVMSFGDRTDEAGAMRIVDLAIERGMLFFDTANKYQDGESERLLGKALEGRRDRCVVATKVGYGTGPGGGREGVSRAAILQAVDQSLRNLGTDHVDIYYLHGPDHKTPFEETFAAMDDLVRAGKTRYVGISNFAAWQSLQILHLCQANGWARPVVAQVVYNPLMRMIEHEYVSFARAHELYLTCYNPLAGGLLTGKYAGLDDRDRGFRFRGTLGEIYRNRYWSDRFIEGMFALKSIAEEENIPLTHLVLRWIAQRGTVDNIILGPGTTEHLLDCIRAGERPLSEDCVKKMDEFLVRFDGTSGAVYAR
jgi:aryl-alcohol dehydrogenase-like predicted oxidoreductase